MSSFMKWMTAPAIEVAAMMNDTLAVLRKEERYRDVPAVEPNAGLIAEALIDGSFTLLVGLMVGVPDAQQVRHGHRELLAMREFIENNGWFDDPMAYHQTPPELRAFTLTARRLGSVAGPRIKSWSSKVNMSRIPANRGASVGYPTAITALRRRTSSSTRAAIALG